MKLRTLAGLLLALFAPATAVGGEVSFSSKPTATKAGDKTKIAFAVSASTDVEVAVLDAQGKVVRHLAAGVLGGQKPPPEPLKAGLSQAIEWDGRDDAGKPAAGGPFKARVRAGMSVTFGKVFGTSPYTGVVGREGLAVADDGTLYVKMASYVGGLHNGVPWHLRRFDKAGKYQKTLLPYAPSTPPNKVPGFQLIDAGDGLLTPAHTSGLDVVLFRFGDCIFNRVVDGQIVFIDNATARLTFFKVDGTNAVKIVPMRSAPDKLKWAKWLAPQLAFSPDGKYAYYSNVANTPYAANVHPAKMDQNFPQGRVYRQDLTRPGSDPEKFYDLELPDYDKEKYWVPDAWNKRTAAYGVDVDAKGHLFICDLVNQGIVEVSPEGKKLSFTKAPWPEKVMVEGKSGDFYVVSRLDRPKDGRVGKKLVKISGRGDAAKIVVELPLKGSLGESIAVDSSGNVPALWLGGGGEVLRLEDRGTAFAADGENILNPKDAISFVCYGDVDAENDLVYITQGMGPVWRYSGETGEGGLAPIKACDLAVGPGGLIYTWGNTGSYAGPVTRYTRDFKPAPLASTGKHTYGKLNCRYGRGNSVAGLDVDPHGRVYATNGGNSCHVEAYDAEGNPVQFEREGGKSPVLIGGMTDQSGSIRVDRAGNVYVLQLGPPKAPQGFEKDPAYLRATGTIYKFGPKGGNFQKFRPVAGDPFSYGTACGPISGAWASTGSVCHCTKPRFDLDGYGRLYIPNGVTFKVTVLDNADNRILSFGGYGNWDAQGPKSAEPKPEIPLGWPIVAGASDRYIYVGDGLNHRVVRVDKQFAAAETCEVK